MRPDADTRFNANSIGIIYSLLLAYISYGEKMIINKIPIVDDDPDVCKGMELRLKADHYDIFFATDAVSTLSQAHKHEPNLIIVDLGLPAGDGFVVIEKLKVWPCPALIPVIVVSAQDLRANKERAHHRFAANAQ
jgi:DNA-binding response OmpR family regulator